MTNNSLPILYCRTSNENIQQWQIVVENNSFYTIEGIKDGKLTTSLPTFCDGKNIGKKNETSPQNQALKEAKSKWKKKIESGYFENINHIDEETFFQPMLAKKYSDEFDEKNFISVYIQPKLDGLRLIESEGGSFSRTGKPIVSAPHIHEELQQVFKEIPNCMFDGEIYNHDLKHDFNKIISFAMKTKPTKEDLIESEKYLQYWIYDYPSCKKTFGARYIELTDIFKKYNFKYIKLVPTQFVSDLKELNKYFTQYLQEGFEGQMIRYDTQYENKRTKYLLKRKEFIDEEYEIVDITEGIGNRSGMMGRVIFKMKNGKLFESNVRGNQEYYIELLKNKNLYIGKMATVRYQNLTPEEGVPRFPVCVGIRDYE
jgi:DNA ligase-1